MTLADLCELVLNLARKSDDPALAIASGELVARARGLAAMVDDLIGNPEDARGAIAAEPAVVAAPSVPEPVAVDLGEFWDGWKEIASQCGRSERWCRYMAEATLNPLPVVRVGGMVRMFATAYDAWLASSPPAAPSPTLADLMDRRFGRLVVTGRAQNDDHGRPHWRCACDCGDHTIVVAHSLTNGSTTSCGCARREIARRTAIDETGKRHGALVVLERVAAQGKPGARWRCRCDCGRETVVLGCNLRSGNTTRCGPHHARPLDDAPPPVRAEPASGVEVDDVAPMSELAAMPREPTGDAAIGWAAITTMTRRSDAWCRFMDDAANSRLRLPVERDGDGIVWMSRAAYDAWCAEMGASGREHERDARGDVDASKCPAETTGGDGELAVGWPAIVAALGGSISRKVIDNLVHRTDDPLPVKPGTGRGHPPQMAHAAARAWLERNAAALAAMPRCKTCKRVGHRTGSGACGGGGEGAVDADEPERAPDPAPVIDAPPVGTRVRWYSVARGERLEGRVAGVTGGFVVARTDLGIEEHVAPGAVQVVRAVVVVARDGHRRQRARDRATTIAMRRITNHDLAAGAEEFPDEGVERPRSRGDCVGAARPCPWVACKHHLYLEVNEETGSIKLNFPDLEPDELEETCSLDVADRGGVTLDVSGAFINLTRERVRQIETKSLLKLKGELPDDAAETLWEILAARDAVEAARPENAIGSYDGKGRAAVAAAEVVDAVVPVVDIAGESEAA